MSKSHQKSNSIRAESVLSGRIQADSLSGRELNPVIKQPPVGALGLKKSSFSGSAGVGLESESNLAKASSGVQASDSISASGIKGISEGAGDKLEIQFGSYSDGLVGSNGQSKVGNFGSEETVEGGLNKDAVRRTLSSHRSDIRTCYERALTVQKRLKGRIVYKWLISAKGPTIWVNLVRSEVGSSRLESCVKDVISKIIWPIAPNNKETMVNYPFEFHSKD